MVLRFASKRTMNKKKLFLTIGISAAAFSINYFISFFLTSYVTDNIGVDAYGFVSLSKTFASYAVIATTALNSYAARYITLEYHNKNYKNANVYFNSILFGNLFCGAVLLGLCAAFEAVMPVVLNIPAGMVSDVRMLFLLVFFNLFVSLVGTAFQASAIIKNKLIQVSVFRGISYVIEAVTLLAVYALLPAKVYYAGIGMLSATLFLNFAYCYLNGKYTPELKISIAQFRLSAVKELVVNGIWNSFNSLGNTLNSGLDLLVSNTLLNAVSMGYVSIVKTIVNIFSSLYQMVCQPFEPILLKDYANGRKSELIAHLKSAMKLSGLISNLAFAGVVGYGAWYYRLWIPKQDCELLYRLTIIAVATSIFEGAVYPLFYIYTLTIRNKIPCVITIVGGLLNVIGMYFLIQYTSLSVYAVFITTAVIMLLIHGVSNPLYTAKCLDLPWHTFYPELLRHVLSCGIMTVVFSIVSKAIVPRTWILFIISGGCACVVGSMIHLLIAFGPRRILSVIHRKVGNGYETQDNQ